MSRSIGVHFVELRTCLSLFSVGKTGLFVAVTFISWPDSCTLFLSLVMFLNMRDGNSQGFVAAWCTSFLK